MALALVWAQGCLALVAAAAAAAAAALAALQRGAVTGGGCGGFGGYATLAKIKIDLRSILATPHARKV